MLCSSICRTIDDSAGTSNGSANDLDPALGAYDFFPITYILPGEYAMFVEEFKRNQGVWIMKPIGKYVHNDCVGLFQRTCTH